MRKPVVDYRQLRPSNINSPQYRHLLWLLGWVGYIILYFLTENIIPAEDCYPVWCPLDDVVPFNELFVIFYVGWYALIVWSLGYFLLFNPENFKGLQKFIIVTQAVAMVCYILFPTRQDLRPAEFPRENFLTWILGIIYTFDTNTGVCPSLHVAYSVGIASTWLKERMPAYGREFSPYCSRWVCAFLWPSSSSILWWIFSPPFRCAFWQRCWCTAKAGGCPD